MTRGSEEVLDAASVARAALRDRAGSDWSVTAGDLDWDVRTTMAHVCDAVCWYAAHLASRRPRRLRFDFAPHLDASNAQLLDVLDAAAATLAGVVDAAPPGARGYHTAGMADASGFVAMACDEILVHTWDCMRGLGGDFDPPPELAERTLRRLFPWAPPSNSPWSTLLWANGRVDLPGTRRPSPDWVWHCAPLDEWDGTVPRVQSDPPSQYRWDSRTRRWRPDG